MIVAILGHTTLAEAERYTEEADQAGLAEGGRQHSGRRKRNVVNSRTNSDGC